MLVYLAFPDCRDPKVTQVLTDALVSQACPGWMDDLVNLEHLVRMDYLDSLVSHSPTFERLLSHSTSDSLLYIP